MFAFGLLAVGAPDEPTRQGWRMVSYVRDAGLEGCNVFHLDFEREPAGSGAAPGSRLSKVWLASSRGLIEYDGYGWRHHGVAQGLPSDFVRCVLVTRRGDLWVGTDRGAGTYDGKTYRSFGSETNLAGPSVRRIVEDHDGTVWFCSDPWPTTVRSGGLTAWRDGKWVLPGSGLGGHYVVNYFRDASGRQWAVTKERLLSWNGKEWVTQLTPSPGYDNFSSGVLAEVAGGSLFFSAGYALFRFSNDRWELQKELRHHQHGLCATRDGQYVGCLALSAGRKALAAWTSDGWVPMSAEFDLPRGYSEEIREDPDGNLWVVGFETVKCWRRNLEWQELRGLPPPKFTDGLGRVWFGRDRFGTLDSVAPVRFDGGRWETLDPSYDELFRDSTGAVWGRSSNTVTRWIGTNMTLLGAAETGLRDIQIGRAAADGGCWLAGLDAAGRHTLAGFVNDRWERTTLPITGGELDPRRFTTFRNGAWLVLHRAQETNAVALRVMSNQVVTVDMPRAILSEFNPGFQASSDGSKVWSFGESGIFEWTAPGPWRELTNITGRSVVAVIERDDELWVASTGATGGTGGVSRFRDGRWRTFPIESVFDLSLAADKTILLAGLGQFAWIGKDPEAVPTFINLPEQMRVDRVVKDLSGAFWVGNESAVYHFSPNGLPPETRIHQHQTNVTSGEDFTVRAEAVPRFDLDGPQALPSFSWQFDDEAWTDFTPSLERRLPASTLTPGLHRLAVRARDPAGDVDATPAVLTFRVHPVPLQNQRWFGWAVAGAMASLTLLAITAIRARAKLADYAQTLEAKVADRTAALEADLVERRGSEAAVRASEERLTITLDALLEGCQVIGFDWRYLYVNRVGAEHCRRTPAEFLGNRVMDLFPAIVQTPLYAVLRRCLEERVADRMENVFAYPDGTSAIFDLEIRPVPDGVFVHSVDITARKEAERALRESERRFVKAFQANPAIIVISTYPDGTYIDVNDAFCELLGFSRAEVLGRRALELGVWPMPSQRTAIVEALDRADPVRGMECTLRSKSGELLTVLASAERIELDGRPCVLFLNYDITARKKAEAVVVETQARFRQVAENIREVFWLTNADATEILYISPAYERIWGRSCESLCRNPRSWIEAVHPDDRSRIIDQVNARSRMGAHDMEYRVVRPDGSIRHIHDRAFPVQDATGMTFRVAGFAEDVTERRQLETQFRQAQKMEALGTLAGGIAHDFNNILGAIFGHVHLAGAELAPDHPSAHNISQIAAAATRARNLVRQILAFSRRQPQARQIISLAPIIQEAASLLRATLPAGVELVSSIDPQAPPVLAEASQIHQVLVNLGTNAWQAMDGDRGRIEIQLGPITFSPEDLLAAPDIRVGRYARVSVSDNGRGMDTATLERIFEPFFTTKEPGRGTGLGLAVVHGIIQAHDGVVRVQSQPGKGTDFHLYFPAVEAEAATVQPAPTGQPNLRRGSGQRILYLDDEAALVDLAIRMLRRLSYDVDGFTHPAAALDALRAAPARYQLIVTDLHMPDLSGLEFVEAVRKTHPNLPVIISSGCLADDLAVRARVLGVNQLLHKPNTLEDLSEALHGLLESKQP